MFGLNSNFPPFFIEIFGDKKCKIEYKQVEHEGSGKLLSRGIEKVSTFISVLMISR
jgi:hypothetical protein